MPMEHEEEFLEEQTPGVKHYAGYAYLERINTELREFNQNYKDGNINGMKDNLDLLYSEIFSKLQNKEKEEITKVLNDTTDAHEKFYENPRQTAEIIHHLFQFNLKLREFLEKHKFLMPNAEDPRDAAYR